MKFNGQKLSVLIIILGTLIALNYIKQHLMLEIARNY